MKALISGFALLTFLAATTLPLESYAQTSPGGATTDGAGYRHGSDGHY